MVQDISRSKSKSQQSTFYKDRADNVGNHQQSAWDQQSIQQDLRTDVKMWPTPTTQDNPQVRGIQRRYKDGILGRNMNAVEA